MKAGYFKLEDPIVQTSLESLAHFGKDGPILVGGLAIQLHAEGRPSFSRGTPDADLLSFAPQSYESFSQEMVPTLVPFFKSQGYAVQPKRGRLNNTLKVIKDQNKPHQKLFLMHWTQFSPEVYEDFQDYVAQQIAFAKPFVLRSSEKAIHAVALEELLPLKVQRCRRYGTQRESVVGPLYSTLIENAEHGNWGTLAQLPLLDWKKGIEHMQERVMDSGNAEEISTYKLSKDLYDIGCAARVISDSITSFDKDRYEANVQRIVHRQQDLIAP